MSLALGCWISSNSVHPQQRCGVISFFKMVADVTQFYFLFRIWWRRYLQNVRICRQTKFRSYSSIHSWNVTIFGYEKQTSAILEFYFRVRFLPYHRRRHVILHQSAKFHANRTAHGRKITSCRLSKWRISSILYFRGPITGSLKSPCRASYNSSIALNWLICEKIAFLWTHFGDRQTDRQTNRRTDEQAQRIKPPSLLRAVA